ncbi:MAG: DeoR family transcriptional regulator [Candidatus Pacebacteria bacterium]|jgi:transcriptional regulator of heat shock response|nr:DeoR family transcriptional regulator [Candidatus Paceibacterota bacterium]MDD3434694.1 DeoR family transcriptional regulator [Candidatus Paceibacterota bacterium]
MKHLASNRKQPKNSRHQIVLKQLIQSYIEKGEPVASQYLVVHYGINFSSATIRNDLQELTSEGYLEKFHVSSGRVPTNKAWKFFIENLAQDQETERWREKWRLLWQDKLLIYGWEETLNLITRQLNIFSFCYLPQDNEVKKCGFGYLLNDLLEELLRNGKNNYLGTDLIENLVTSLENFDNNVKSFNITTDEEIFVGNKIPFIKLDCLSTIIVKTKNTKTLVGVLGNKRMAYAKNLGLLRLVADIK